MFWAPITKNFCSLHVTYEMKLFLCLLQRNTMALEYGKSKFIVPHIIHFGGNMFWAPIMKNFCSLHVTYEMQLFLVYYKEMLWLWNMVRQN
jgi:hypothetical protein